MNIVGIGMSHDASAALIKDGRLVAAIEEERLVRVKHYNRIPFNALRLCMQEAGLTLRDLDAIAIANSKEGLDFWLAHRLSRRADGPDYQDFEQYFLVLLTEHRRPGFHGRLEYVSHHLSHVFSAYAVSGFDD